ncbi:MAG TPA: SDR family oxidoreductase [Nitriliruptoraceae bacterium]|nr:SDR family oxidoreductase [Nitriliruptoraceae bacterium]
MAPAEPRAHDAEPTGMAEPRSASTTSASELAGLFRLDGRTIVVVGAGGGIGRACAAGLAAHGAHVVCADLDATAAESTATALRRDGGRAAAVTVDVLDPASVATLVGDFAAAQGVVITPAVNVRKALVDTSEEDFDRVVALNLKATFRLLRAFGRAMAARDGGSIAVFTSIRATVVEPGQGVYAATKAGVMQLVATLAAELGPRGVRVNAVAPGIVETPLTAQIKEDPDWARAYREKSAFGRWARPSEMAGPIVFLMADASSYVTASQLAVDGGWTRIDGRFSPPL